METALAVLLTALAFVWIGDDEDEENGQQCAGSTRRRLA